MPSDIERIRRSWGKRQAELGNTRRSVMLKNLPDFLNTSIHNKHISYILSELPSGPLAVLDVGCGWGRISLDLIKARPDLHVEGIELNGRFAARFSDSIGPCVTGPVQEFSPEKKYDVIMFVTSLMYLDRQEMTAVLIKMWKALNIGGKLICIEPATNFLTTMRQRSKTHKFKPTGESVAYFQSGELAGILSNLPHAEVSTEGNIGFLPFLNDPAVHRAVTSRKNA